LRSNRYFCGDLLGNIHFFSELRRLNPDISLLWRWQDHSFIMDRVESKRVAKAL
jgi:hypothetical protein